MNQTEVTVNDLTVYEGCSGFYILNRVTGEEAGMGDGVGMFSKENGETILAGSRSWWKAMQAALKADYATYLDAYFPEEEQEEEAEAEHVTCDRCSPSMIQGVFCHEAGCPNDRKEWVSGRGWVRFIECRECGDRVEEGEPCTCMEGDPSEHSHVE